eukprot:CAMPEP_0201956292 /NCGR_PEP_ID=MMETSP0904-20121228/3724_1 /ASSEMBLY_ACC=CAM_ASM_000553 /TAXON_ID=420261 /ORGANISM="Thalassiosira antarctica, Strain CCMP982" /LENGTH=44 /DNA_ID= /DNA_START= /DNA_END= /DNA_ORIENTATION=
MQHSKYTNATPIIEDIGFEDTDISVPHVLFKIYGRLALNNVVFV